MSVIANNIVAGAAGQGGADAAYEISRSVRFNSSDSAYLSRTPSSAGNRKTWTWSGWVKRSYLNSNGATYQQIFAAGTSGSQRDVFFFDTDTDDTLAFFSGGVGALAGGNVLMFRTNAVFRDASAWYHILISVDTTQSTASDRVKLYVNNTLQTFSTANYPALNAEGFLNQNNAHYLGSQPGINQFFDGYLADVHFIDGQALDPTDFGEYDYNNVWQPKAYSGTYGTNGFHLDFSDNSTAAALGTDTSGNSNDWTVNNISVAAGAGNDSFVDSPTNGTQTDTGAGGEVAGNYCTWNPLNTSSGLGLTNGNLNTTGFSSGSLRFGYGTIGVSSGKWYYEATPTSISSEPYYMIGFGRGNKLTSNGSDEYMYYSSGERRGATNSVYAQAWTANDVIGVALDLDAGTLVFYKNGVSQGTAFTGITGTVFPKFGYWHGNGFFNFGQRSFTYTAPSGFKALCTANLDAPVVTKPSDVFDTVLWTGVGSAQSITGLAFSPDLVFSKSRNQAYAPNWYDIVRGAGKRLRSDSTSAEDTNSPFGYLSAFNSDGFTFTPGTTGGQNGSELNTTYVAWTWDAGDSTVTNTDGSITSQVRANPSAGFSIVSYTGNGTGGATVGHGLGVTPSMILIKRRSTTGDWIVHHKSFSNLSTNYLNLNNTTGVQSTPTALFSIGASTIGFPNVYNGTNQLNTTYVAYCFAPVDGYSSFGSYTGNGSTDGPFVYTGFRPRWILVKSSDATGWTIIDTARDAYNLSTKQLFPHASVAELDNSTQYLVADILSNGFKLRTTHSSSNTSSQSYVFAAFAESPFQYARAR